MISISVQSIKHWLTLKAQLTDVKAQEIGARKDIASAIIPAGQLGTKHASVGDMQVKVAVTDNYTVKVGDLMSVSDSLTDAEKECIKWVPEIKKGAYKKLPADAVLRTVVTMKFSAPSVEASNMEVPQ